MNKYIQNKTLVRTEQPACTTMIVGKKATVDGSVIVAHSDDDVTDERVIYVPAADYPDGAKRPVYYDDASLGYNSKYNSTELRRYIGTSRGPGYNTKDYPPSKPLGEIPQVKHTYAYFDSSYGIMNEHQLMIGECTCGAKVHPEPEPGKRIFYSAELSRVALERCTKAREAIKLISDLIEQYGYYGTGETLLIGDPDEAWVMEMCGYDKDGTDGIWVAQRVPDDGYFVAANEFRIRKVDVNSLDMMYSANLFKVCEEQDCWKPSEGQLDWLKTVSWGEYSHPYYSLRRVWRALSKAAPSLNLPAWVEDEYTKAYPFSVNPDKKLSVADIAAIYRDHYEGTEFDLTKGRAAGPFGDPTRYEKNPDQGDDTWNLNKYQPKGAWERPLSIYRCGMMWINQGRSFLPDPVGGVSWIGLDRPAATCLMPFYAGVNELPELVETMNLIKFTRDSAWWAFNFVGNYATIKYSYMINDINEKQKELEGGALSVQSAVDQAAQILCQKGQENLCRTFLTSFCKSNTEEVVSSWWKLSETLIVKYNDGCITEDQIMQQVGYPEDWLNDVGYLEGPTSYKKKQK
ncbi:MAG: C69 family dipeptidase [Deltaproteobacteria bacterium]|nr:C69 family dipeptidase [Deltaproteobacteria bacterium]